ncbi:MAG: FKBP-type peptidyl-prolyl cis-trans isomerase [Treponema sp.]|nr:FKBP-type peptidyl-prolyl cis-trans isomerase [Treponema sp.]
MKNKFSYILFPALITAVLTSAILLGGCQKKPPANPNSYTMDKDASYAIGMYLASQWQIPDVHYDYNSFMQGFRAYNESLETKFNMDEAIAKIQAAFEVLAAKQQPAATSEADQLKLEEGRLFLDENGKKPGVITTASGLEYEVLVQGSGPKPAVTDTVQVNYEGTLTDGTVFDSSYARGEPIEFALNGVIPGWTEGVQLMNVGSTYMLYIPSDLGYGSYPAGDIPPNSVLIFKVELLDIIK